ncbi:hypothetical protein B0A49_02022 [Cryomyces minteri]|uniref:Cupin 2 conserved barrel domain-containing protein n=1 Tax=Cryomyces minteri TaxID=331657 RepID=A0A4U0XGZ0_9PEZI|nr:hypothetical protein B0A49_02022 [Cryomyces minteri]
MPRTLTRDRSIFFIPGQGGITFHPNTAAVTITLPVGSTGRTGLHWHETHTEFLSVLQGVALITLGTVTETFRPADGTIAEEGANLERLACTVPDEWREDEERHELCFL